MYIFITSRACSRRMTRPFFFFSLSQRPLTRTRERCGFCVCKFRGLCILCRFVARLDLIAKAYNPPFSSSRSDASPVSALCPVLFRKITGVRVPLHLAASIPQGQAMHDARPRSLILDPQGRDFIHKSRNEGPRHASLSLPPPSILLGLHFYSCASARSPSAAFQSNFPVPTELSKMPLTQVFRITFP